MVDMNSTIKNEKAHIELALQALRPLFPGKPDLAILAKVLRDETNEPSNSVEVDTVSPPDGGTLNPEMLEKFARERKTFKTSQVMEHFGVTKFKAAGSLAALTRAKKLRPDGKDRDGHSQWRWSNNSR
jgi:hypothetical protein